MKMNVGIIGGSSGWREILRQAGIPFTDLENVSSPDELSCLIVSNQFDGNVAQQVLSYLQRGGSLLCSTRFYSIISGCSVKKKYIRYLKGDSEAPFFKYGIADIEAEAEISEEANSHKTDLGEYSTLTRKFHQGNIVSLPFDAGEKYSELKGARRSFYSSERRLPHEMVSAVSKGEIFRMIMGILEFLHFARGYPFVHKWLFPRNFSSVFNWRIDTDGATEADIRELYDALEENNIPATWFIDGKSQQENFYIYRQMRHQEFGSHGFQHRKFSNYDDWVSDMRTSRKLLSSNGLGSDGYASPYGAFDHVISRAISSEGFVYSSEFSYDYDNVPSFPQTSDGKTLQVPIHPICIGSLRRQGYDESAMMEYFRWIINKKLCNHEPVFLYHHPGDNNVTVVRKIFSIIESLQIPRMTLGDYARWWKKRESVECRMRVEGDSISVIADRFEDDVWIRVVRPDGSESFHPMKEIIRIDHVRKGEIIKHPKPEGDVGRAREFNYRIYLNRVEDLISSFFRK